MQKNDDKKFIIPKGLTQKPLKRKGTPIGTRELTSPEQFIVSTKNIPRQEKGALRVLFFGGVDEIGKNMYALEYEDEILILDCGMAFSNTDTPGIGFILPNIQYLIDRKEKIKGLLVSHAHLDHIGGISPIMDKIGNPTIFSRKFSIEVIRRRHTEFTDKEPLNFHEIEKNGVLKISEKLTLTFFSVTHTIPDSMATIIDTPVGSVVFTGDLKLSHKDGVVDASEEKEFSVLKNKKVLLTMADSTNATQPGFSLSEERVIENIGNIIRDTRGRVVLGGFGSQIDRMAQVIERAIKDGRKVVVQGRSLLTNFTIVSELGLVNFQKDTIIPVEKMNDYPKEKILIVATGTQGEEFSALDRISLKSHKYIELGEEDTVILSSSIVPGNEMAVQGLKDRLSRLGVNLITYKTSDVHSSGHANRDELKWIHEHINARFFTPIHGYHYMMVAHGKILEGIGMPKENIVIPENGGIVDISPDGKKIQLQEYTMPNEIMVVDGNAIGPVQPIVLKDRRILRNDGILVVIVLINKSTWRVKKSPDVISRGFIYLKESITLVNKTRMIARRVTEKALEKPGNLNIESLKREITRDVRNFLYANTRKRPIIIPVIFIV